jgi:hypothetical protein
MLSSPHVPPENTTLQNHLMRMRLRYVLIYLFISLFPIVVSAQYIEEQISTFSSRMANPVIVDVRNNGREFTFTAENSSFYPYHIEIQFTNFVNLSPLMSDYKTDIYHGKTVLFKLTVMDIGAYHDYSYNLQYMIGYSHKKAGINYPNPIPHGEVKEIKLSHIINGRDTTFFRNMFMLNTGDTIFCMRKGIVTNILSSGDKFDRLLKSGNVEVIHSDGTVATYSVPGEYNILVVPGQQVYPLQPLMILKKPGNLTVQMCEINNASVKSIAFIFEQETSKGGNLNGKIVKHVMFNTKMELTDKEKKKLEKGDLF